MPATWIKFCYDDDIQGTGSVTVAGLYNALKITKSTLKDQKILFFGARSAGIGITNMIVSAMKLEDITTKQGEGQISMFDVDGLLEPLRKGLSPEQMKYAHEHAPEKDLVAAIESLKPTILIGVSTVGGTFTQQVIDAMSKHNDRPIIFALSNPTKKAECTAEQVYKFSKGKAVYAAGVQLDDITIDGKTYEPAQANNFYIFPAVGMAVYAAEAKRVPDEIFIAAARASADQVTPAKLVRGRLFPSQSHIQAASVITAVASAERIFDLDLARVERPASVDHLIGSLLYHSKYPTSIGSPSKETVEVPS